MIERKTFWPACLRVTNLKKKTCTPQERLKLDSEIDEQLVKERREDEAMREESIAHQVKKVLREFYCDICDVQYQTVMQMEEHLSSYNHNHKKRFIEMKEMMKGNSSTESSEDRENLMSKREMEKAMKLASAAAVQSGARSIVEKPPDRVVESLESGKRSAVKVSLLGGGKKKKVTRVSTP